MTFTIHGSSWKWHFKFTLCQQLRVIPLFPDSSWGWHPQSLSAAEGDTHNPCQQLRLIPTTPVSSWGWHPQPLTAAEGDSQTFCQQLIFTLPAAINLRGLKYKSLYTNVTSTWTSPLEVSWKENDDTHLSVCHLCEWIWLCETVTNQSQYREHQFENLHSWKRTYSYSYLVLLFQQYLSLCQPNKFKFKTTGQWRQAEST